MRPKHAAAISILLVGCLSGCQSGAPGARFLSLVGLSKKPVVIALTPEPGVLNPFDPYEQLRRTLEKQLAQPVRLELAFPFQVEANLELGFYNYALIGLRDYLVLGKPQRFEVLAVSLDSDGQQARPAVLVVPANSPIERIEELRGKTVAFGPVEDARSYLAGLALLNEHGIKKTDLSLELLPVPGSVKHFAKMRDIAQSVMNFSSDAGFIDVAAYQALPDNSDDRSEPCKRRLRVLARTRPVPDKVLIRSPKADPQLDAAVREFFLSVGREHPDAVRAVRLGGFAPPGEDFQQLCDYLSATRSAGW